MDIMENAVQTLAFDHIIESKARMKAVSKLIFGERFIAMWHGHGNS